MALDTAAPSEEWLDEPALVKQIRLGLLGQGYPFTHYSSRFLISSRKVKGCVFAVTEKDGGSALRNIYVANGGLVGPYEVEGQKLLFGGVVQHASVLARLGNLAPELDFSIEHDLKLAKDAVIPHIRRMLVVKNGAFDVIGEAT